MKAWIVLVVVLIGGCGISLDSDREYTAYKDGKAVLEFQDKPGFIASTGYFPDEEPKKHPFISAVSLTPDEEDSIGKIITRAETFDGFISLLEDNGYEVK